MSPSESARSLGRMHQRKAGEQVEIDVNRRKDHIIVVADEDIMIHDAIHEILD